MNTLKNNTSIYVDREHARSLEEFLHRMGYVWYGNQKYIIRDEVYAVPATLCIMIGLHYGNNWMSYSVGNVLQNTVFFQFPENLAEMKKYFGVEPTYEPRQLIRD